MKSVFTTGEAAEICKVSQQTIIRCFDSGRLRGFRVPGSRFRRIPRDALIQFMSALRIKPQSVTTWQEFIRALYVARFFDEAMVQLDEGEQKLGRKPVFIYFRAAVLITTGRTKEGLIQLETALQLAPRQLKKMVELDPTLLQHTSVVELIARYRKKKK